MGKTSVIFCSFKAGVGVLDLYGKDGLPPQDEKFQRHLGSPDVPAPWERDAGFPTWASDIGMTDLPWLKIQLSLMFSHSCGILGLNFVHCLRWGHFVGY